MEGSTRTTRQKPVELPGTAQPGDIAWEAPRLSTVVYARRARRLRRVALWTAAMLALALAVPAAHGMATTAGPVTERVQAGFRAFADLIPGAQAAPDCEDACGEDDEIDDTLDDEPDDDGTNDRPAPDAGTNDGDPAVADVTSAHPPVPPAPAPAAAIGITTGDDENAALEVAVEPEAVALSAAVTPPSLRYDDDEADEDDDHDDEGAVTGDDEDDQGELEGDDHRPTRPDGRGTGTHQDATPAAFAPPSKATIQAEQATPTQASIPIMPVAAAPPAQPEVMGGERRVAPIVTAPPSILVRGQTTSDEDSTL